jgi:hypothetical protein
MAESVTNATPAISTASLFLTCPERTDSSAGASRPQSTNPIFQLQIQVECWLAWARSHFCLDRHLKC